MAFAVVEVEDKIVLGNEVARRKAQGPGGLVDGRARAFQFDKGADRRFIVIEDQAVSPFETGGKAEGGAELFVAEPTLEAKPLEDSLKGRGVGQDEFDFLADLVASVLRWASGADGELFRWGLEGEEGTRGRFLSGRLLPCGGRGFGADAEELTVLGKAAVRGIEEEVVLVDPGAGRFDTELFEGSEEGRGVVKTDLDFGFARHAGKRISDIERRIAGGHGKQRGGLRIWPVASYGLPRDKSREKATADS